MRAFGHSVLAPLLADFGREHPGVAMELLFTERRVDLVREGVDVAFRVTRKPPEDCVAQPVLRFRVGAFAAAGPLLRSPQDLQALRLLMLEGGAQTWPLQWRHLPDDLRATVELQPHISADNLEVLVELARRGQGVVFAPDFCVADDIAAGRLLDLLPEWELPIAEGDCVQAMTLPVLTAGANARALVRMVARSLDTRVAATRSPTQDTAHN